MVKELPTRKAREKGSGSNSNSTPISRRFFTEKATEASNSHGIPRHRQYATIFCVTFSAAALLFQVLKIQPNGGLFNINATRFMSIASSAYSDKNRHHDPRLESLPMNANATLADDVLSIEHDVYNSKVIVTLRWNARCQQPYLIGRLSGPALVKVDNWTFHVHRQQQKQQQQQPGTVNTTVKFQNTTMEGTYRAPVGGQYFLEITAIYCQDVFYKLKHEHELFYQEETQNVTLKDNTTALTVHQKPVNWLESTMATSIMQYNFIPVCMENPFHHRLTSKFATIWVDPDTVEKQRAAAQHIVGGFWYYRQQSKKRNTTVIVSSADSSSIDNGTNGTDGTATLVETQAQKPLHTRHQPYECMMAWRNRTMLPPACVEPASPERYSDYQFKWNHHPLSKQRHHGRGPPLMGVESLVLPKPAVICFIGASHSRFFKEASERLNITQSNNNLTIHWAQVFFPADIRADLVNAFVLGQKCDKVVIAVGQWPASYQSTNPLLFPFYAQMKVALENIVKFNVTKQVDVYARNIHYNPLTHFISTCPPSGWRNPMVIDGYNAVLQQICRELSPDITYLDTQFLTDAIWDGSPDWCHLDPEIAEEELLYVAASVLGLLPSSNGEESRNGIAEDSINQIIGG